MRKQHHQRVADYYDATAWEYRLVLNLEAHHGLHFGYYDTAHKTYPEASLNMNRVLADRARVGRGMRVLDAGCGIGGSSVWLAKHRECFCVGITLSAKQCARAQSFARDSGVSDKAAFLVQDYTQTHFPNASFDVVWAVESVCHAPQKITFLKEAYRLLRPGGTLIIADGFRAKRRYSPSEEQLMRTWLDGWVVPDIDHHDDFVKKMTKVGFFHIHYQNATPHVLPFSRWVARRAALLTPIAQILRVLGIFTELQVNNGIAATAQYEALTHGLWEYGVTVGKKA